MAAASLNSQVAAASLNSQVAAASMNSQVAAASMNKVEISFVESSTDISFGNISAYFDNPPLPKDLFMAMLESSAPVVFDYLVYCSAYPVYILKVPILYIANLILHAPVI